MPQMVLNVGPYRPSGSGLPRSRLTGNDTLRVPTISPDHSYARLGRLDGPPTVQDSSMLAETTMVQHPVAHPLGDPMGAAPKAQPALPGLGDTVVSGPAPPPASGLASSGPI